MSSALLPTQIGPFAILSLLGQGASGRVYRAQEQDPARIVALKVLRTASLSSDAEARFKREAELLARLEHPAIARLYRAGVANTDAGPVPYLAMELIAGEDLLTAAKRRQFSLADKLALLAEISRTVHYAHSRGVVHRDLKPSNILVDAAGHPHILDFGVGHLVRDDDAGLTIDGQILGTVPYMSTEQLAGGRAAGDPRTDVYALGVIAYELLSGSLPFPGLSTSTVMEAIAVLREGRAESLAKRLPEARGDTDTVVMKAMAPEAAQRYGSADALANDLDHIRAREPISARPPTASYLLRLFVRRHRALSGAAAVVLLSMLAATVVSARYALSERAARQEAAQRAASLAITNRYLENILAGSAPDVSRGRTLTLAEVLDNARIELATDRSLDAETRIQAARTLGLSYRQLGDYSAALAVFDQGAPSAANLAALNGSEADDARLALEVARADALIYAGRVEDALQTLARLPAPTPADSTSRSALLMEAENKRADALANSGRSEDALAVTDALIPRAAALLGADAPAVMSTRSTRIDVLYRQGLQDKALAEIDRLLPQLAVRHGPDHPETLAIRQLRALILQKLGRIDEATAAARSILADRTRVLGDGHVHTAQSRFLLSDLLYNRDTKSTEAQALMSDVLATYRRVLGPVHPSTLLAMNTTAIRLEDGGQPAAAEQMYGEIFAAIKTAGLRDDDKTLAPYSNYAYLLMNSGRLAESEKAFRGVVARARAALGVGNGLTLAFQSNLGECLLRQKRAADARAVLTEALTEAAKPGNIGLEHPTAKKIQGRLDRAVQMLAGKPP